MPKIKIYVIYLYVRINHIFWKVCLYCFPKGWTYHNSLWQWMRVLFLPASFPKAGCFCTFWYGTISLVEVIISFLFWDFPQENNAEQFIHILLGHLYVSYEDMSVDLFAPFGDRICFILFLVQLYIALTHWILILYHRIGGQIVFSQFVNCFYSSHHLFCGENSWS